MEHQYERARALGRFLGESAAELLWPTRCAICDTPGSVLCEPCERSLPYIDYWRACPRCGSPFGLRQCTQCTPLTLAHLNRSAWPFTACASATFFTQETGRIVRVFKDQGERRLAGAIAGIMARTLPPGWPVDALTYIPASAEALRRRGFDHGELLARELAALTGAPLVGLFEPPHTRDQRALGRAERVSNLQGRFQVKRRCAMPSRVLLIDDVFTTGATLCDATDALRAAGTREVRCLTFARVY